MALTSRPWDSTPASATQKSSTHTRTHTHAHSEQTTYMLTACTAESKQKCQRAQVTQVKFELQAQHCWPWTIDIGHTT